MIDLSVVMETAARDPLVVAFTLMVLGGLTTHFLCKHAPLTRAIVRVVCLLLLTLLLLSSGIVPYRPLPSTGSSFRSSRLQFRNGEPCWTAFLPFPRSAARLATRAG